MLSRSSIMFDSSTYARLIFRTPCLRIALAHITTAHTACEKRLASFEYLTFSATAEAVGIAAALGLRRTWQLRACGACCVWGYGTSRLDFKATADWSSSGPTHSPYLIWRILSCVL